jgi:hypothetical protein
MTVLSYNPSPIASHRAHPDDDADIRRYSISVNAPSEESLALTRADSLKFAWFTKCSEGLIALACTLIGYAVVRIEHDQ